MIARIAIPSRLAGLALLAALALPQPGRAASAEEAARLYDALGLDRILAVMAEEGRRHGDAIADDMFPGRIASGWAAEVERIYDEERLGARIEARFAGALQPVEAGPLLAFFEGDLGRRIIELEIGAREAMLVEDVEAVAEETWAGMLVAQDPRADLLEAFVEANDLVESNVSGSMNASFAFFEGLAEGGAFTEMSEDEIIASVWSQENEIRLDTEDWVYAYLALAYRPLEDAELEAYTEISRSEPGQGLNRALFAAFDAMFVEVSHLLGRAAAREVLGQDI